jgi:hypothetical protein
MDRVNSWYLEKVLFFLDGSHQKNSSVLVHTIFLKFWTIINLLELSVTAEPVFSISDFLPVIFDVFSAEKPIIYDKCQVEIGSYVPISLISKLRLKLSKKWTNAKE